MEWCFDKCNLALHHPNKEAVSTAANPHCSAAVLYSNGGETLAKVALLTNVLIHKKSTEWLRFEIFRRSSQAAWTASACI